MNDNQGKTESAPWPAIFGEVIGAIIGYLIITYGPQFLPIFTDAYSQWLPIGQVAVIISAVFRIASKLSPHVLKQLFEMVALAVTLYSTYKLAAIFPLDFAGVGLSSMNQLFRFVLYVAVFGIGVAFIVQFFTIFFPPSKKKER